VIFAGNQPIFKKHAILSTNNSLLYHFSIKYKQCLNKRQPAFSHYIQQYFLIHCSRDHVVIFMQPTITLHTQGHSSRTHVYAAHVYAAHVCASHVYAAHVYAAHEFADVFSKVIILKFVSRLSVSHYFWKPSFLFSCRSLEYETLLHARKLLSFLVDNNWSLGSTFGNTNDWHIL
jgi:hypothetical protein